MLPRSAAFLRVDSIQPLSDRCYGLVTEHYAYLYLVAGGVRCGASVGAVRYAWAAWRRVAWGSSGVARRQNEKGLRRKTQALEFFGGTSLKLPLTSHLKYGRGRPSSANIPPEIPPDDDGCPVLHNWFSSVPMSCAWSFRVGREFSVERALCPRIR